MEEEKKDDFHIVDVTFGSTDFREIRELENLADMRKRFKEINEELHEQLNVNLTPDHQLVYKLQLEKTNLSNEFTKDYE